MPGSAEDNIAAWCPVLLSPRPNFVGHMTLFVLSLISSMYVNLGIHSEKWLSFIWSVSRHLTPVLHRLTPFTCVGQIQACSRLLAELKIMLCMQEWIWFYSQVVSTSNDDDEGSENVTKKRNLRPFKPYRVYLDRLICQMWAIFHGVEFLRTLSRFKKRKENSSSYVHVLHKTRH